MAHFEISFDNLQSIVAHATSITSDSVLRPEDKTLIFFINKDSDSFAVSRTQDMFARITADVSEVHEEGVLQLQVTELAKILGTFSNLSKTEVDKVEMKVNGSKVQVLITEVAKGEGNEAYAGVSSYGLDNLKLREKTKDEVLKPFPEGSTESVDSDIFGIIIDSLLPVMSNTGITSQIHFTDKWVYVGSEKVRTFYKNPLPDLLQNATFRHSSIGFIRKITELSNELEVVKDDRHLAFRVSNVELFVKYIPVKVKTENYLSKILKDDGVIIDRAFLKDIIRRLSIRGTDTTIEVGEEYLTVKSDGFERTIPIINTKGSVVGNKFKIKTSFLASMIVGDDKLMADDLFIYMDKAQGNRIVLTISDSTGAFLANTTVS